MTLSEVFAALGLQRLEDLLRSISMGKLKTFQMFDRLKARTRLTKLNTQNLRKSAPRLMERLSAGDEDLAKDLGQVILLSHFDLIVSVLNHLGIPHEDGFFDNELDSSQYLKENWREDAYEAFHGKFEDSLLVFYLNFLAYELKADSAAFLPEARARSQGESPSEELSQPALET